MSLLVWLPLNGDLDNYGLNGAAAITTNSAAVNASGKIGPCYLFNGTNNYMQFSNFNMDSLSGFSIACWIKPVTDSIGGLFLVRSGSTHRIRLDDSGLTFRDTKNSTQRSISWNYTFIADKWVHVCTVYKQGEVFIYCDGELTNHNTSYYHSDGQTNTSNTEIRIGRSQSTSGNVYFNGSINDFRIYDHTLSAKEVKEISKGLVLHYKLDNNGLGNPNILTGTYYNSYKTSGGVTDNNNVSGTWAGGSGGNGTFSVTEDPTVPIGKFSWNISNNTSGNRDFVQGNQPYVQGQKYTSSFWAKGNGKCLYRSWNSTDSKAMFSKQFTLTSEWQYFTYTFTASEEMETDMCTFQLGVTGSANISICGMKMELGDKATPYTVAVNELTEQDIIYDSSGYQNHGIPYGAFSIVSNTPRYNAATHLDGNINYIRVPFNEICPDNIFTINLWFKKDALGSKNYETLFGGPSGFEMDTRAGSSSTLTLYMASTRGGNVFSSFSFGQWYMVTMVRDGTNELYYVNGDLKKTIAAKPMPTGIYRIGAWNSDTGQNYYGEMSDFRIYNTVLSAEDIKELYNTSVSIDKNGNIYAREVIEI